MKQHVSKCLQSESNAYKNDAFVLRSVGHCKASNNNAINGKKTKKTCENYEKQDENIEKAMQKL